MKRLPLPSLAVFSFAVFAMGCGEKPVVVESAPPLDRLKPKPKVYRREDLKAAAIARDEAMAKEIAELEAESEKLRQEIALEQVAIDRAALEEEQRRLEEDRGAWLKAQAVAAAKTQPAQQVGTPVLLPPVRDYSFFYSELSVHGRWFQSVDYGYVWQPSVALETSWRPYTMGRWAACDCGWTWLSDEPFGWATYHYGRWTKLKGCGWIWVPGEVWAPAWVAWRRSDRHVGWCPLPPETLYRDDVTYDSSVDKICGIQPAHYIFIPVKQFCLPVHRHCEPPERSAVVCRNTTNITRLSVRRDRVDGSGPKYDWIKDRQPRPPDRYILAHDPSAQGDRKFRTDRDKLCVFAPVMRAPWNPGLRPREVAGPLPGGTAVPEGTKPPDKMQHRFREDKKVWAVAAAATLQGESGRRLMERRERVEALAAAVQNPALSRPLSLPGQAPLTPAVPGAKPTASTTESLLSERRAQREQARQELSGRQAELAQLRGLPVALETAPVRVAANPRPAIPAVVPSVDRRGPLTAERNPEIAVLPPAAELVEIPRRAEIVPVNPPAPPKAEETPLAQTPAQETATAEIAEAAVIRPDAIIQEAPVLRDAPSDREALRAEVARLKETLTIRQQQQMGPHRQSTPVTSEPSIQMVEAPRIRPVEEMGPVPASGMAPQTPHVPMIAGPQPPAGANEPLSKESSSHPDADSALETPRENAARLNEELAVRQAALQQQREIQDQARTQREQALAQSAAGAARQREAALEQSQTAQTAAEEKQQQLAAEQAARQQESAEAAAQQQAAQQQLQEQARQQQQEQLAAQAEAARAQQQESEATRQRVAGDRARQAEQAALEQAQRQALEQARQEEMGRQQQEAAERAQQEQAAREQALRQAEERARQEAIARQQQEAAERARQEQAALEQAQRQAEERARQEEMARQQQEAAERAQQEQAAREQAQRQAEERARQEEAARQQQEAAERARQEQAAREQAQRQAEEAARAAAEAAKNANK